MYTVGLETIQHMCPSDMPCAVAKHLYIAVDSGSGIQRGFGAGPVAWERGRWTHWPQWVSKAVVDSLNPSVRTKGTQPGAHTCTT